MENTTYQSRQNKNGERFIVSQTSVRGERCIAFTYISLTETRSYIFIQNEIYNSATEWTESACQELATDLASPSPTVDVLRYELDGELVLDENGPVQPTSHESAVARRTHYKELLALRDDPLYTAELARLQAHEAKKCEIPAPFIVYARHDSLTKEYAWRLTPDKPKRQGIEPGDRVLVWTKDGYTTVTVSRVEPAREGAVQPTARVKKKLS